MTSMEPFTGPNSAYLIELYEAYLKDSGSVDPQVRSFFDSWAPYLTGGPATQAPAADAPSVDYEQLRSVVNLVERIRDNGHLVANLDPLGLRPHREPSTEATLQSIPEQKLSGLPPQLVHSPLAIGAATAQEVISKLRDLYFGSTGYEFGHIRNAVEKDWLQHCVESGEFSPQLDSDQRLALLKRLSQAEAFEHFLHRSFPGQKWFSVEGNDTLVPVLDEVVQQASRSDVESIMIAMAHRGRLNVLTHIFEKPYDSLLAEFMYGYSLGDEETDHGSSGDVKYHQGAETRVATGGNEVTISMFPNPSHLELVNPAAVGAVRAIQDSNGRDGTTPEPNMRKALGILVHGDAAFAGEGVVPETLNMAQLEGYTTGGIIHIIVNNQIGFTTEAHESYSTPYASDIARGFDIPIIHVNADDVEGCLNATRLAFAYRERFNKDFLIDLIGYRRYGHNEGDEPSFTQPVMYNVIHDHPTVRAIWAEQLIKEGVVSAEEATEMVQDVRNQLQEALTTVQEMAKDESKVLPEPAPEGEPPQIATSVPAETLMRLNEELHAVPEGFSLSSKLERPLLRRREAFNGGGRIDWAHAEALSFASIIADGTPIRISGQDTERGTFTQRHAVFHDVNNGDRFTPLASLPSARAPFAIYNSPLSEQGVLGFEYGYSVQATDTLVLWEAQFGDFVNNTQSIVDEFIASAKVKWGLSSGLVLLLPHGYEGQGPNHSSGFLERFLQLANEGSFRVAYCSTAAQYFHLLREQAALIRTDPRPLVIMTAKSLLRHPDAASSLEDLSQGSFQPVIDDARAQGNPSGIKRVILCTGKVYVDLIGSKEYVEAESVAIVRVEELYPFPSKILSTVLGTYGNAEEVVWLQEEPQKRGAWSSVEPKLRDILKPGLPLVYIGRPGRSSPAEGSATLHKVEQDRLIREGFAPIKSMTAAPF